MKKTNTDTRKDAITKDIPSNGELSVRTFSFPSLGISVKATSFESALKKAKELVKEKSKKVINKDK